MNNQEIKHKQFTRKDYLSISLLCIIFYSFLLGRLFGNLNSYLMTINQDIIIGNWLKVIGLLAWLIFCIALAYGAKGNLEFIGFGTIAVLTGISIIREFVNFKPILLFWLQVIFSIIIIITLSMSIYNQIKKWELENE